MLLRQGRRCFIYYFMKNHILLITPFFLISACTTTISEEDSAATGSSHMMEDAITGMVTIDGSSTVFPITEAMAEEFQKKHPGSKVVVGISGTGGGFKRFCRGEISINDASRPIDLSESTLCRENGVSSIELPVAFDGIAVMVHPSNDWVDFFTVDELKTLWEPNAEETITHWNQIRPEWPDKPISLYGPGVDSGTYDYFTDVIVGKEGVSRGDFVASEDDNVLVQGIASDPNALGFFSYAYYQENTHRLKLIPVSVIGNDVSAVSPSPETINDGSYAPLSRPIFIYANTDALGDRTVSAFIDFYLDPSNAASLIREVGYVPLPPELYLLVQERVQKRITQSLYQQEGAGDMTLSELLHSGRE
ncbi:hypothetical protein A3D11_02075 [Candidatus Peribacteria bacterium RIFCSPHIGHO2_02_FULL_49_16]|nr:MAG: hypothetical protein A2880_01185 [Candidatus Peribacteria bacterium RIFCSPHIGHO2_01_FULL_49_38]OGJ58699.1 MAG: hypothetical protein A3D11_02075 [Candidatus Peribacteria bacterium RIFCSPHIGHO2_02_FULL_49_16]